MKTEEMFKTLFSQKSTALSVNTEVCVLYRFKHRELLVPGIFKNALP